jgi:NTP pyrophosphatase (non-canonical NTP hydrolase)
MNDQFTTIQFLRDAVANFNAARDWNKYHKPSNIAKSICIEAAELLECYQWEFVDSRFDKDVRKETTKELADIIIYCLSFANVCEIDISAAVAEKMKQNGEKYPTGERNGP